MVRIYSRILLVCVSVFYFTEGRNLDPVWDDSEKSGDKDTLLDGVDTGTEVSEAEDRHRGKRQSSMEFDKLDELCRVFGARRGGHSSHLDHFERAGRLRNLDRDQLHNVENVLEHRRFRTRTCCRMTGGSRYQCFEDYHINRVDDFCGDGAPDVPFPRHRHAWHTHRRDNCCHLLAMDRLRCFKTTFTGAPSGADSEDDLNPAYDIAHYQNPAPQIPSADIAVDDSRLYSSSVEASSGVASSMRSTTSSSSMAVRSPVSAEHPARTTDVCCVAGEMRGSEITSHAMRTCSRRARNMRRKLQHEMHSEMSNECQRAYRTCCLQVALRSSELDVEDSDEDSFLLTVLAATRPTTTHGDDEDDPERNGNYREGRTSRPNSERNDRDDGPDAEDEDTSSVTTSARRSGRSRGGHRNGNRRSGRHRNHRRSHRRGRRRNGN